MKYSIIAITVFAVLIFTIPNIDSVEGAEIPHYYEELTTCATTGFTNTELLEVTDSSDFDFISGREYLIMAKGSFNGEGTSENVGLKLTVADVDVVSTMHKIEPQLAHGTNCDTSENFYNWFAWFVLTSDGTDTIKIESNMNTGDDLRYNFLSIMVIEISEDLTENTDWFHDTGGSDSTLGTAWDTADDSTITFTPANNLDEWLILGTAQLITGSANKDYQTRLNWSGGSNEPVVGQEGEDTSDDTFVQSFMWILALPDSSQTLEVESQRESGGGGTHTRESSEIFALNLSVFQDYIHSTDSNTQGMGTGAWSTTIETIDFTPSNTGDVAVLYWADHTIGTFISTSMRLQVEDNSSVLNDQPPGQTTAIMQYNDPWDTNKDRLVLSQQTVENLNTNTHTINVDMHEEADPVTIQESSLLAFTFELAGAPTYRVDLLDLYESESTTLGSGNSMCQNIDLEIADTCFSQLQVGHSYRFEVTVINDSGGALSPTIFELKNAIDPEQVVGEIPVGYIIASGCSTETDWTESISSNDARGSSGTTCSISASGGTQVFYMVIRIGSDAVTGTILFKIDDTTNSDLSTATTFRVNNIIGGQY